MLYSSLYDILCQMAHLTSKYDWLSYYSTPGMDAHKEKATFRGYGP